MVEEFGSSNVEIEMDAQIVVIAILWRNTNYTFFGNLVLEYLDLLNSLLGCILTRISCTANIARASRSFPSSYYCIELPIRIYLSFLR